MSVRALQRASNQGAREHHAPTRPWLQVDDDSERDPNLRVETPREARRNRSQSFCAPSRRKGFISTPLSVCARCSRPGEKTTTTDRGRGHVASCTGASARATAGDTQGQHGQHRQWWRRARPALGEDGARHARRRGSSGRHGRRRQHRQLGRERASVAQVSVHLCCCRRLAITPDTKLVRGGVGVLVHVARCCLA